MSRGARVLQVEDQAMLAEFIADFLTLDCGLEVQGPAPTARAALSLVDQVLPAAAILDICLGSETSFSLARTLIKRGVPIIFFTARDDNPIPRDLIDVKRISKLQPFGNLQLILEEMLGSITAK